MKNILTVAALSGALIPGLSLAELNYNTVDAGYSTTTSNSVAALTELGIGISNSIAGNIYIGASYKLGSQFMNGSFVKVDSITEGVGYHIPIKDDTDGIAEAHLIQISSTFSGVTTNSNGYDIGAGIRKQLFSWLDGTFLLKHASTSSNTLTSAGTFIHTKLGWYFIPETLQITLGIDLKSDELSGWGVRSTSVDMRFFY